MCQMSVIRLNLMSILVYHNLPHTTEQELGTNIHSFTSSSGEVPKCATH